MIEPTDEMEQALLREVDRVGVQRGGIRAGLAAVLAIVERDYDVSCSSAEPPDPGWVCSICDYRNWGPTCCHCGIPR